MTRIVKTSVAGLAMIVGLAAGQTHAGEKAMTKTLPPALAAMGVSSSQIMDRSEADEVRGEGLLLLVGAAAKVNAGAAVIVPGVAKVGAAAAVNLNVGVGLNAGLLNLGGKHGGKCY